MASTSYRRADGPQESIGALLARLRLGRGMSQLHLAEQLCAVAATPTVTRHEVSRWEREDRIPGPFWLGWLAVVLEAPLERLEAGVAQAHWRTPERPAGPVHPHQLWRPATATELLAALDHAPVHDLRDLAHAWLAGPDDPADLGWSAGPGTRRHSTDPSAAESLTAFEARLAALRRADDMVGGLDLAGPVDRDLRPVIALLRAIRAAGPRRRALRLVAGYAQLCGWAHADAGDAVAARRAYRVALRAATAAGDRPMAAHVLGALSHQSLAGGDPREALLLARTGSAWARAHGSALIQALLLHRCALAAAHLGERRAAEVALVDAERAAGRSRPDREPEWLYWLDPAELAAMTGRCWAVLGRPLRAARMLTAHPRARAGPRTAALYATWLARSYLAVGEVEQACRIATRTLRKAVAAGSIRAADGVRHLHPLLLRHRDVPVVRRYERLAADASAYLPGAVALGGRRPGPGRRQDSFAG